MDNNLSIIVANLDDEDNLLKVVKGEKSVHLFLKIIHERELNYVTSNYYSN